MYTCLIVLEQSHDSETWITFFCVFSNITSNNVKSHIFGFKKCKNVFSNYAQTIHLHFVTAVHQ